MFEEPNERPPERPIDPTARAKEKADEFRMHAELAAVFEGVFALHVGVERIGRYLQVAHEADALALDAPAMAEVRAHVRAVRVGDHRGPASGAERDEVAAVTLEIVEQPMVGIPDRIDQVGQQRKRLGLVLRQEEPESAEETTPAAGEAPFKGLQFFDEADAGLFFGREDLTDALVERFGNPALPHRTQQIAMDGSQKLPQRLLNTVRDRLAAGGIYAHLALAVAGWMNQHRWFRWIPSTTG